MSTGDIVRDLNLFRPGPVPVTCSSAETCAPANTPTTAATPPHPCRRPDWSPSPEPAGASRKTFQAAKGLAGLDQHQLRRHTSWTRWVTLAMAAHAFLAVARATEHTRPHPPGLIPLSCNEIRHLFMTLTAAPVHVPAHRLAWSTWRRRHQARAPTSHYRRQATRT
jgi:hypothetical protein